MTPGYRSWTGPARTLAVGVDAAVTAARDGDAAGFDEALAALAKVDHEQLGILLGDVTRAVLERLHPDGLDSDDAGAAIDSCVRAAAPWYPGIDPELVLRALAAALGVEIDIASDGATDSDLEDCPPPARSASRARPGGPVALAHGLLLVADLVAGPAWAVEPFVDGALRELLRAQTVEMP